MNVFVIYLLIFSALIYRNGFFKIFADKQISSKAFTIIFVLKALAVPTFYFLFVKLYGGIEKLDTGKFYTDAKVMNELAYANFFEYLKMMFGFQDDSAGSYFYKTCIETTNNWDNGQSTDFFYNDNRIVIRIHSLLHFISFNSYFAHAFFSCFFSFIGLTYLYKTFKGFFKGSEFIFFIALCFFPTLWLYSGGLLKEGITILFLGVGLFQLSKLVSLQINLRSILGMLIVLLMSFLLKPYLLFYSLIYFLIFFIIFHYYNRKYSIVFFVSIIFGVALLANGVSVLIKHKSLIAAAKEREKEFSDLAKGGIFLLDSSKFVRLTYDYNLIEKLNGQKEFYTIKKNVSFTYWEHSHQGDTLFCEKNGDTNAVYSLVYDLPTAGSNVDVINKSNNIFIISARSLYFTLAYPLFFNAKSIIQILASIENLILILSLLIVILGIIKGRKENFPAIALLIFGLSLFIIIGISTPNSGAILRYRSPAAIFIIASALYSLNGLKKAKF